MTHLNLDDPADRLRAMVRLRGCEDQGCWLWFGGTVYGRPLQDAIEPLFGFHSVLWMTYTPDDDGGYVFRQRESCHFTDLKTGEHGSTFSNPYTGASNPMIGYVSPVFAFRFYGDGTAAYGKGKTPLRESRLCPDLETGGDDLWSTEWRRNEFMTAPRNDEFPDASPGSRSRKSVDLATYRAPAALVLDLAHTFVPAQLTFVADIPWIQWMFMADRPGHMLWSGTGLKTAELASLPHKLRDRVEHVHPGFLDDPFGMDATPYGTLAQMRQLKEEGQL